MSSVDHDARKRQEILIYHTWHYLQTPDILWENAELVKTDFQYDFLKKAELKIILQL